MFYRIFFRRLYKERLCSVESKLEEVRLGRSKEYLGPLEKLQENMRIRIEVTAKLREYRLQNLKHKADAEEIGGLQNYEVREVQIDRSFFSHYRTRNNTKCM